MKKVFLSILLLTGIMATAQEKPTQTVQKPAQTTQIDTPAAATKEVKSAVQAQPTTAQPTQAKPAKKTEATIKEEKAEIKKADPAKKSN